MLRLTDIRKNYKVAGEDVPALKGVSVNFRANEFVSILGPSGCGKTTLLNIIGGLDKYTSGDLVINGRSTKSFGDREWDVYRNHRIGFVFQSYNLVRELTAWENILLPVMLDHRKCDQSYLDGIIEILGIGDRLSHLPGAMSGGQQQRVCIARALANKPSILFADEPTGNLDGKSGREVLALLKRLGYELGITLVLVTHDQSVAEQAGRIIELRDGIVARDSGVSEA